MNFRTRHGGSGDIDVKSYLTLRDPNRKIDFPIVADGDYYPGSPIPVDPRIRRNRWLTGGDFDIESVREDKDGKSTGPLSPTSRNNYRRAIGTLFYFAESRGYVPKGIVDIESLTVAKKKAGDIEIFRPEEMARIMAAAKPELIPFLAIGADRAAQTAPGGVRVSGAG